MPDLDDNINNVFRTAADNYMVNAGESNWNKIAPLVSFNTSAPGIINKKHKSIKNKSVLLVLLVFVFAGTIINYNYLSNNKSAVAVKKISYQKNNFNSTDKTKLITENKNIATGIINNVTVIKNEIKSERNKMNPLTVREINNNSPQQETADLKNSKQDLSITPGNSITEIFSSKKDSSRITGTDKKTNDIQKMPAEKLITLKSQHDIYFGITAGAAFSEVKSQGLKKPGYNIGITAGYKINNKISVETGLLFNEKKYFSNGKYFSLNKIGAAMPAGMKVMSLEGKSSFLQIPVKVKYDVLHKNNTTVFSSAGISSYIITGEKNDYHTLLNGFEQQMKGSYKQATKYFAATADISAGFENKIGKYTSIRVEPYLQIPLKGVGIGSMPLMSTGLNITVIKFMH